MLWFYLHPPVVHDNKITPLVPFPQTILQACQSASRVQSSINCFGDLEGDLGRICCAVIHLCLLLGERFWFPCCSLLCLCVSLITMWLLRPAELQLPCKVCPYSWWLLVSWHAPDFAVSWLVISGYFWWALWYCWCCRLPFSPLDLGAIWV